MRALLLILPLLVFTAFPAQVQAQEVYQCGVPEHPTIENMDDEQFWRYCDIHTRRFAYIKQQERFRRRLDIRRRNYVDYRGAAVDNYKAELQAYYADID